MKQLVNDSAMTMDELHKQLVAKHLLNQRKQQKLDRRQDAKPRTGCSSCNSRKGSK